MKGYEECKKIALEKAKKYNATINHAYSIGNDFVFDSDEEYMGVLPVVVRAEDGSTAGIWFYLEEVDKTWDDLVEIEL